MPVWKTLALRAGVGLALCSMSSTAFAEVDLSIREGRVSLVARDATVRQILTEWARIGQTRIINLERIPGGPLTLELKNVPEAEALDILLRSLSGYMAAPRIPSVASASQFDRIIVMPTTAPTRAAASGTQPPFGPSGGLPQVGDEEDGGVRSAGPVFGTVPRPQVANPQPQGAPAVQPGVVPQQVQRPQVQFPQVPLPVPGQQPVVAPEGATFPAPFPPPAPSSQPSAPLGAVPTPGMIAPAPTQQPGQVQQGAR